MILIISNNSKCIDISFVWLYTVAYYNLLELLKMEQTYKSLAKLVSLKPQQAKHYQLQFENTPENYLEKFLQVIASKQGFENNQNILTKFLTYMTDQRFCKLLPQYFSSTQGIHVLTCSQHKNYIFDSENRAYCLYGKAVSLLRRKGKDLDSQRSMLNAQLQNIYFQLHQDGALPFLSKNQSHQIEDILLHFDHPDESADPILLSNQVFSPFLAQPFAIVLILPISWPRPDQTTAFIKSSLLHVYIQQANLLHKVMFRQTFYKNTNVRGIYFIQEGEVQSTGGRIVARGWITNGKCKSTGYGWKFKPLPFAKAIARNQHIWKQFMNDLILNHEYPFKLGYFVGLEAEPEGYDMLQRKGKRGIVRLPRIGTNSFDYGKLTQIQKMKHYDDRLNDICDYKQKLLLKKAGNSVKRSFQNFIGGYEQKQHKRLMLKHQSKDRLANSLSSSSENILIMSVLKKLEGLTQQNIPSQDRSERRDKIKISPAHLYQKSRIMKKKRYNQ